MLADDKEGGRMNNEFSIIASCGCTMDQAIDAANRFASMLPPLSEADIWLINANPNLSKRSKRKLARQIKEYIIEQTKEEIKNDKRQKSVQTKGSIQS